MVWYDVLFNSKVGQKKHIGDHIESYSGFSKLKSKYWFHESINISKYSKGNGPSSSFPSSLLFRRNCLFYYVQYLSENYSKLLIP